MNTLDALIITGKKIIKIREETAVGLSNDYLDGFSEGVAEMIAAVTKEAAADILECLLTD